MLTYKFQIPKNLKNIPIGNQNIVSKDNDRSFKLLEKRVKNNEFINR